MAEAPIMPLATDAYLGDTGHLTTAEHGAYLLLLMVMWRSGGTLPDDDVKLRRITKTTKAQWDRMKPTLMEFFHVEDGVLRQGKLNDMLNAVRLRSKKASDSARAKWRKNNETDDANAERSQCERDAIHYPLSKEDSPFSSPTRKKPSTRLPENWQPSEASIAIGLERGMSHERIQFEATCFREYAETHDRRCVNWNAAFTTWLRKTRNPGDGPPGGARVSVWAEVGAAVGRACADDPGGEGFGGGETGMDRRAGRGSVVPFLPADRGVAHCEGPGAGLDQGAWTSAAMGDRDGLPEVAGPSGRQETDAGSDQGAGGSGDLFAARRHG